MQNYAFEFYDWLLERLDRLDNRRLASRLAQDYISRALGRDNARVTRLVQRCLAADPAFRPRSGAETLRVAELSRLAGDRSSAQALLVDFERHFPGDRGSRPGRGHGRTAAAQLMRRAASCAALRCRSGRDHTRQIEHQHLGLPALAQQQGRAVGELERIAARQRHAVGADLPARHVHIEAPTRRDLAASRSPAPSNSPAYTRAS